MAVGRKVEKMKWYVLILATRCPPVVILSPSSKKHTDKPKDWFRLAFRFSAQN